MNKLIIIAIFAMILTLGSVSAWELNPFAEKLEPIMVDTPAKTIPDDFIYSKVTEYPVLRISETFLWFTTDKIAEYKLEENTKYCLINCEFYGKAILYKKNILFDDVKFITFAGKDTSIASSKYLLKNGTETYTIKVPEIKETCELVSPKNETKNYTSCDNEIIGYKDEERVRDVWLDYDGKELPAGEYEWKLVGKKDPYQSVDAIPIAQGKILSEWATWTSSYNTNLQHYWDYNETTGSIFTDAFAGKNISINNKHPAGIIGNAYGPANATSANTTTALGVGTMNAWVYREGAITGSYWGASYDSGTYPNNMHGGIGYANDGGNIDVYEGFPDNTAGKQWDVTVPTTTWVMMTLVYNDTALCLFVNGSNAGFTCKTKARSVTDGHFWVWFSESNGTYISSGHTVDENSFWNRTLSASEISDLYNGGLGLTYIPTAPTAVFTISTKLNSPENQSNFSTSPITFSANATYGYGNLTNMSLYIWNSTSSLISIDSNLTVQGIALTAITNQTQFTKTFALSNPDGLYSWNVLSCAENGTTLCKFSSANRTFNWLAHTLPNVTLFYKSPADIDILNVLGTPAEFVYNGSSTANISINFSSGVLYHKTNKTTTDIGYYENGSAITGYQILASISNTSANFTFSLRDNSIYPATYNYDETIMEATTHALTNLANNNYLAKVQLLNISNTTAFNFFEIMTNSSSSQATTIYYCNSSYSTGSPLTYSGCVLFGTLAQTTGFNHTHTTGLSKHQVFPFGINLTDGTLSGIKVTPTSYFIQRGGNGAAGWDTYYIAPTSRTDAIQISTNTGTSWTNQTYTIDAHTHQYTGASSLWYYACLNDTNNNNACSAVGQDLLNLTGLPPTSPSLSSPTGYFADYIPINYTAAVSPNQYTIDTYNISLLNADESYNQTIRANNSQNLSYLWDGNSSSGIFKIKVEAIDNKSQTSFGISDLFTLYGTQKTFNATTYETAFETYSFSLLYDGNWTSASTTLNYGGTSLATTQAANNSKTTRDIPVTTTVTPTSMFWTTTVSNSTSTAVIRTNASIQTVNPITYGNCNASNDVPFIKLQFVNETIAQEAVPGYINSAWRYYIGSGLVNKSLSYANTTEARNWTFCLSPSTYPLRVVPSVTYANSESASRSYNPGLLLLNSSLTTKSLFLLPNSAGTYVSFQVINPASQVVSGALIEVFQGTTSLTSGTTDGAGIGTFFLNPISSYTIVVTHPSYTSTSVILTPTQASYTIQLGGVTGTNVSQVAGIYVSTAPKNAALINGTTYLFNMTVTSSSWTIDSFGFNLGNITNVFSQFNTTSGTYISGNMSTGQNDTISMYYFWVVNGTNYNATRYWKVIQGEGTEYSISYFASDLKTYLTSGMFGLTNFGLAIIVFIIIFGITGIMSYKFGLTSPAAIAALVFVLVLFFDVGLGLVPNPLGAVPYFPSILVGVILGGLLIKEMT